MMRAAKVIAAVAALVGWAALALQYVILAKNIGPELAAWRFVGFFTILSNIGVAGIATAVALGRDNKLTGARARLMGVSVIVMVGLIYSLLLRHSWHPQGLQKLVDIALHDVMPILFVILWALMPHGELGWRDMKWALTPPALYLAYSMARGAIDGWYPYYFLNPTLQTGAELAVSVVGVLAVFAVIAGSAIAVDRRLGVKQT